MGFHYGPSGCIQDNCDLNAPPCGSNAQTVTTPTDFFDFSMFLGGVAPTTGLYQAYTPTVIWTFNAATDTQWSYVARTQG